MLMILILVLLQTALTSTTYPVNFTTCSQSATLGCSFGTNRTDYLLSLKKGGSNVLSTADYDPTFFPCEEYNFDCGYVENLGQYPSIAEGVELSMTPNQLSTNILPNNATLAAKITPYLGLSSEKAACAMSVFPLTLTDSETQIFFSGFMNRTVSNISTTYTANKPIYSLSWPNLNINNKTAVLEYAKQNYATIYNSTFWSNFLVNNFTTMSSILKNSYQNTEDVSELDSSYLIDSVTSTCNKYQSINFLIDESGSIGLGPFQNVISFLNLYVNQTLDDLSLMSIDFFDSSFDPYIGYGNNKSTIMSMITTKSYRGRGTYTGLAINASINRIASGSFKNGVPKLLVILTDGGSRDNVLDASNYARSQNITLFCVGIGPNVNTAQLLQITGTKSNIVYLSAYTSLQGLVDLIKNYFCKQITNVNLNDFIEGNIVRVPTSPSYFRVAKSTTNQYYQMTLSYASDPSLLSTSVMESQIDPFPDQYSEYPLTENYRTNILTRVYYIQPQNIQTIPLKKLYTINQSANVSYISVGGNNLNFNISLTTCATLNCTNERAIAASIGQLNYQNTVEGNNNQNSNNTSVWIGIGLGMGVLALATIAVVAGVTKLLNPTIHGQMPLAFACG